MTLGEWLARWVELYKRPKLKPNSLVPVEACIRLHIPAKLKGKQLRRLGALALQEAINAVETSRMRKYTYDVLNESLRKAYALGLLPHDIMREVEPPLHAQRQGTALTSDELAELFGKLEGHKLRPFYLFCLLTGCRRSEALGVTFADIDVVKETLTVRGTKTKGSFRVLPLFPAIAALMGSLNRDSEKLFCFNADYVTHVFKRLCPEHKLHDLRHTFATRCIECGISIRVIQQWLGHSKLETTANRYVHILDDFQRAEALKFRF